MKIFFDSFIKEHYYFQAKNLSSDFLLARGYGIRDKCLGEIRKKLSPYFRVLIIKALKCGKIEKYNRLTYKCTNC